MKEVMVIKGRTAAEVFQMKKERYNAFAYGHGTIADERCKQRNRKSKRVQRERYQERRQYVFD